eukprot:TRINITY_DN40878_c0_g1_i1.p1 TRINITY_DN40878_c0_g1~~TRINITY_DN40878_c0_g1_i1.p1  ORF type:complete len:457 (-),score=94.53 TRINITY_DN40878_c0_g1_i1:105-1475(-)
MAMAAMPSRAMLLGTALMAALAIRLCAEAFVGPQPKARSDAARISQASFESSLLGARQLHTVPPAAAATVTSDRAGSAASIVLAFAASAALLAGAASRRARSRGSTARRANLVATRPDQAIPWWDRLSKPKQEPGIGIWAEKLNMTTFFVKDQGNYRSVPASILVVKRGGNMVTDKKWPEKHGYYAIQVGYERFVPQEWEKRSKGRSILLNRLRSNELPPLRKFKEFKVRPQDWEKWEIGDSIHPSDIFQKGDEVDVHGITKHKGFQGAIKRWGHKRGPMTHGSKHHRRYGSVGAGTTPGRVLPGKKMPGYMGGRNSVSRRLEVLKVMDHIDEANMPESIIVVKGTVPGYNSFPDSPDWEPGGSYVWLHKCLNKSDGRFKQDPVWLWYYKKGEGVDPYVPLKMKAWTWKTLWGRDMRWVTNEVLKYWPDGFPGYDHSTDPFFDGCDPHKAVKAPEW